MLTVLAGGGGGGAAVVIAATVVDGDDEASEGEGREVETILKCEGLCRVSETVQLKVEGNVKDVMRIENGSEFFLFAHNEGGVLFGRGREVVCGA